jgi:hypothetical protein
MRTRSLALLLLLASQAALAAEPRPAPDFNAFGMGINLPLAARITGAGNTLYITSLDVTNHSPVEVQVDFYLDAVNQRTQSPVIATGSVTMEGIVPQGAGGLRGRGNAHFSDFFASLAAANLIPTSSLADGVLGSVLFVFNGVTRSGQGSVTARFRSDLAGGTVGVALRGREITAAEPRQLVAVLRDTVGNTRGEPKLYANLFINHIGLTPAGSGTSQPVVVEISAFGNSTGQQLGGTTTVTIASGMTAYIGSVLQILGVPAGSEETIVVFVRVVSGDGAIHGIVSQVDSVTRDGSVFEMSRADF